MKPEGLTEAGEAVLGGVVVRPCASQEWARVVGLVRAHHYLGLRGVVGERVGHVAEVEGQWVALLLWAAAAMKCQVREAWIGWHPSTAWQRLPLVVNNVRFLILPGVVVPNLASRVLAILRNLAIAMVRFLGFHSVPEAHRHFARRSRLAFGVLGL